jgi:hypothetical protein
VIPLHDVDPDRVGASGHPAALVLDLDSVDVGRFSDEDDRLLRDALRRAGLSPTRSGPAIHGVWNEPR